MTVKRNRLQLQNERFGRWFVKNMTRVGLRSAAVCVCDCGSVRVVLSQSLRTGKSVSCGCYSTEVNKARARHGHNRKGHKSRTYTTWNMMTQRCLNPNNDRYYDYGGRGITVCERWLDFANFLADMGERPEGTSIDRIDVNGNYEPTNCRWATSAEQGTNKRHLL
jgi:hypothetical protein